MKIIYRKSDRLIAGYVHTNGNSLEAELRNACNSELGGTTDDYQVVDADDIDTSLYRYKINDDGTAGTEARPKTVAKARIEEIKAIGRDNWTDAQQKELIELLAG